MGYGNIDEDDVDYIYDHEQTNLLISNTVSSDMGALRPSGSVPWLILIFLFPALGGFLFGYDIGGVSSAFNGNANSGYQGHNLYYTFDMTDGVKEAVISTSLLGAILGSLAVFGSGDFLSRRGVLLIGSSFYFGGALIEGASFNLPLLFVGRLVYGIGIGFCMHSAPLYIAEITPPRYRGLFISAKECFIVLGILTGYINGYVFQGVNYGWRYIFYFATIPAAILFTGMLFIPHSPRWLALRGLSGNHSPLVRDDYLQLAHAALAKIRRLPIEIVQPEFNEIYDSLDKQLKEAPVSYKDFFTNRALMRGLMIGCGLVIFQQISGQPSVLYYASTVFADAGLTSAGAAAMATIGVGTVKLLMTIVSTGVVDKFGRRILLSVGIFLMILALLTLGSCSIGITQDSNSFSSFQSYATIIAMMVFVSGYQLGFGPISWLIISEIFPLRVRSKALSIAVICNFGANLIVTLTYLTLQNLLTIAGAYFLYGGIAILSLVFVILFVIETKGCTLEQIEVILSGRNWIVFNPRRIMQLFKKKDTHGDYDD